MPTDRERWTSIRAIADEWLANNPEAPATGLQRIDTVEALKRAAAVGGDYLLAGGDYIVNLVVQRKLRLVGDRGNILPILGPADALVPTIFAPDVACSGSSFESLNVRNGAADRECVVIGSWDATDADAQPANVTIAASRIMAGPSGGHRGIALHGRNLSVLGTHVIGFWEHMRDAQAIYVNNGPGPYTIADNYLEASGENILFGGDDPRIPNCVPSGIKVLRNQLVKPPAWRTNGATVKNSFELKNARNVLVQGNIIDGWWHDGQAGPVQFTPRNQGGKAPWCVVEDVVFDQNEFRNVDGGIAINILGTDNEHPSGTTKRISLSHNLFRGADAGIQVLGGVDEYLAVTNNTFPSITRKLFSFDRSAGWSGAKTRLRFVQNVARAGEYAITGDGNQTFGLPSLLEFCELLDWHDNIIADEAGWKWPDGQALDTIKEFAARLDPATSKILDGSDRGY